MTPLEYELRWERIWNLAVLDAIEFYRDELSIGIDLKRLRSLLRPILDGHYVKYEYGAAAGRLSSLMSSALRKDATDEELNKFYLWGDRIFSLGSDRTAEFVWLSIVHRCAESAESAWVKDAFRDIRRIMDEPRQELARKIHILRAQLSEPDRNTLRQIDMNEESLASCLSLTGRYNIFACAWRVVAGAFSIEQLDEINIIGRNWAAMNDVDEMSISFPGTWDFGLPIDCSKMNPPQAG